MLHDRSIAVVIPAYCEQALIGTTVSGVPDYVDLIVVVDDASPDGTGQVVQSIEDVRVHLVTHTKNRGVGRAIMTGYQKALELGADLIAVMAGDNQMDPADLRQLAEPVALGRATYSKGNRLVHPRWADMPRHRRWGSRALGWLTSLAAWTRLDDTQCGYTAISRQGAEELLKAEIWSGYGYPNDVLITLCRRDHQVCEQPVRPVYGPEASGLRWYHIATICRVILRRWILEARRRKT